ncbi:MarR family transcriptional regulator [Ruegeria pomeroyi]|nr:MarR family transcriptional regulator [Ruegeria pomeroyi]MCE8532734.1 MarR family transcriptional regulator [Ruegeria pomeroyi]
MDHVDVIIRQWAAERPDLDTRAMAVIGRVARLSMAFGQGMQENFARNGLNAAKFDVLATLLRSGPPYALSPGALLDATMVASGTMTNRIDRLEQDGLVERRKNPEDSRSVIIALTPRGLTLINEMMAAHVTTQAQLLKGLTAEEQAALTALLAKALHSAETANARAAQV